MIKASHARPSGRVMQLAAESSIISLSSGTKFEKHCEFTAKITILFFFFFVSLRMCDDGFGFPCPAHVASCDFLCSIISKSKDTVGTAMSNPKQITVDIVSDIMWPWCYVGKRYNVKKNSSQNTSCFVFASHERDYVLFRNLEKAISQTTGAEFTIKWHPFLLRPGMPENGKPKTGPRSSRVGARLKQVGDAVGINFTGATDRYFLTLMIGSTWLFSPHWKWHYVLPLALNHLLFCDGW